MAELVREIVIDATPETIWPFLTEADKHVEWIGTVAEIDPRPGGIYRVLVGGATPVRRRVRRSGAEREGRLHVRLGGEGPSDPARLHDAGDHVASRGRQDARAPRAPRPSRRRGRRSRPAAGRTTSSGWRSRRPAAIPVPTCGVVIAHVDGIPVEELLLPIVLGASAFGTPVSRG